MIIHGKYCCNKEPQKAGMGHFEKCRNSWKRISICLFIYFIYIYLFSIFKKICIYSFRFHTFISRQSWVLNKEATIIHKISETNSSFHVK